MRVDRLEAIEQFRRLLLEQWQPSPLTTGDCALMGGEALYEHLTLVLAEGMADLDSQPHELRRLLNTLSQTTSEALWANPDDERALWRRVALALEATENNFGSDAWLRLLQLGLIDVRWPICAALFLFASSGTGTSTELVRVLRTAGVMAQAREALAPLASRTRQGPVTVNLRELGTVELDGDRWIDDWIDRVLEPASLRAP
jgi:hypothetical protein